MVSKHCNTDRSVYTSRGAITKNNPLGYNPRELFSQSINFLADPRISLFFSDYCIPWMFHTVCKARRSYFLINFLKFRTYIYIHGGRVKWERERESQTEKESFLLITAPYWHRERERQRQRQRLRDRIIASKMKHLQNFSFFSFYKKNPYRRPAFL